MFFDNRCLRATDIGLLAQGMDPCFGRPGRGFKIDHWKGDIHPDGYAALRLHQRPTASATWS
ncbi:MAG: hypothetical protein WDA26_09935 [Pusillimonas sp.]